MPPEDGAIAARYNEFQSSFTQKQYEIAYQFMSPTYHQTHSLGFFENERGFTDNEGFGLTPLDPKHCTKVTGDTALLYPRDCSGFLKLWRGYAYEFVRINGEGYFIGNYEWYLD